MIIGGNKVYPFYENNYNSVWIDNFMGFLQFTIALTDAFKDLKVNGIHVINEAGDLCPQPKLDYIVVAPMESQEKEVTGNGVII